MIPGTLFIGVMSGTSLDGADALLVGFDPQPAVLAFASIPYPESLRVRLLGLHENAPGELEQAALAANECTRIYAAAISELLDRTGIRAADVAAIGSHGQTVRHRPDLGFTLQLQNPALLTELTGITVVADFRSRDVAAGGQGAPLAPAFHDAMFRDPAADRVVVNIGGISNATMLLRGQSAFGFDCGPGNMLMDAWTKRHTGKPFDSQGEWAGTGKVVPSLLATLAAEPYFKLGPPKSSGRDLFNAGWVDRAVDPSLRPQDVQATLLELTAQTIAADIERYAPESGAVYACGGGALNVRLMARLGQLLPKAEVRRTDALGVPAMQVEALAFAWLAKQAVERRPTDLRAVTGAKHPTLLGAVYYVD